MKSLAFFDDGKIHREGKSIVINKIKRLEGEEFRSCLPTCKPIPESYFNYEVDPNEFYDCLAQLPKSKAFEGNWVDAFYVLKRFAFREGLNQSERDTLEEMHKFCSTLIIFIGVEKFGSMITGDVVITTDVMAPKRHIKRWGFHEFLRHHEMMRKNHYFKQQNR